jgi:DNA-binding MarR family transcriptional regulator
MTENLNRRAVRAQLQTFHSRSALFARPGFLIRRLHQIHTWLFTEETQQFNITPVQFSLLTALAEHGEMDQNTVALEIGLERTSVAEVLPRLEARGLVERRQSEQDKRVRLVKISRKGRALLKRMPTTAPSSISPRASVNCSCSSWSGWSKCTTTTASFPCASAETRGMPHFDARAP